MHSLKCMVKRDAKTKAQNGHTRYHTRLHNILNKCKSSETTKTILGHMLHKIRIKPLSSCYSRNRSPDIFTAKYTLDKPKMRKTKTQIRQINNYPATKLYSSTSSSLKCALMWRCMKLSEASELNTWLQTGQLFLSESSSLTKVRSSLRTSIEPDEWRRRLDVPVTSEEWGWLDCCIWWGWKCKFVARKFILGAWRHTKQL